MFDDIDSIPKMMKGNSGSIGELILKQNHFQNMRSATYFNIMKYETDF